jgi:hypothetical protein
MRASSPFYPQSQHMATCTIAAVCVNQLAYRQPAPGAGELAKLFAYYRRNASDARQKKYAACAFRRLFAQSSGAAAKRGALQLAFQRGCVRTLNLLIYRHFLYRL